MMEGRGTGFIIQYNVQCVESRVCVCVCVCVCVEEEEVVDP